MAKTTVLEIGKKVADVIIGKSPVKAWQNAPNADNAAKCAAYYAKKYNQDVYVVQGNSYMRLVYNIVFETSKIFGATHMTSNEFPLYVVKPNGELYEAKGVLR
jgi:mRNA-degrading endonuclease HigB of HigAB toxin-antitoxin module